jgi:hypothetical protein
MEHSVQLASLIVPENFPDGHPKHRSGVDSVLLDSWLPGLHCVFTSQYGCPAALWYLPSGQAMQLTAFDVLENLLAGQTSHRASLSIVVFFSNCPGLQGIFIAQNGEPELSWYLPSGQAMQLSAFGVLENSSAWQSKQPLFTVAFPVTTTRCPAEHVV